MQITLPKNWTEEDLAQAIMDELNPFLFNKIFKTTDQRQFYYLYMPLELEKGLITVKSNKEKKVILPGRDGYFYEPASDNIYVDVSHLARELKKRGEKGLGMHASDFFEFLGKNPNPHSDIMSPSGRSRSWELSCRMHLCDESRKLIISDIVFTQTYWKSTRIEKSA